MPNKVNDPSKLLFLVVIAGRKLKEKLIVALSETGGHRINVIYGKGSVEASYIRDILGLSLEENKVLITCLCKKNREVKIFDMLIDKFDFNSPNTGIAFTIPIEELSF